MFVQMGKMQVCYREKFKFEVVWCAQEYGHGAAGRKFDVNETNVSQWPGEKEKLEGISKKK
jgi:hypothetical protein